MTWSRAKLYFDYYAKRERARMMFWARLLGADIPEDEEDEMDDGELKKKLMLEYGEFWEWEYELRRGGR